jgi:2-dehydro-3-deoxygalactonokinase
MNEINKTYPNWIAVDWGTSNLRYWVMSNNKVLHTDQIPLGTMHLGKNDYEDTLITQLSSFLAPTKKIAVLICGMAGSRQGWKEAPYLDVPSKPPEIKDAINVKCKDPRISVKIIPGLKQVIPADIMRGEETQIMGILNKNKDFDGVICLSGTHTKWVRVSAGEVVSFQTFMTGELFALLSQNSVLKYSVSKSGWDKNQFQDAVKEIMSDNKLLGSKLFNLRAESIIQDSPALESRSRLSGYLIGLELSGSRPYWLGEKVIIVGEDEISEAYEQALRLHGVDTERYLNKEVSLDGLKAIYNLEAEFI